MTLYIMLYVHVHVVYLCAMYIPLIRTAQCFFTVLLWRCISQCKHYIYWLSLSPRVHALGLGTRLAFHQLISPGVVCCVVLLVYVGR